MKLKGSCHCRAVLFELDSQTPYPFMRCYCSICRKTAGGGGYAINIMGKADTLKVKGKQHLGVYQAKMQPKKKNSRISTGQRNFCKKCASCLWIWDPSWPEMVYPFASAIDTKLPKPPQKICLMLDYAAPWCDIPKQKVKKYKKFPKLSIEDWHKKQGLLK